MSRRAIEAIESFYDDRMADSRAISEFNAFGRDLERSYDVLKVKGRINLKAARSLLQRLKEQDRMIRNCQPANKVKRRLRKLLAKREHKIKLKKQIELLEARVLAADSTVSARVVLSNQLRNRRGSASKALKTANHRFGHGTPDPANCVNINHEELLSSVFAAMKSRIGTEDERYPDICLAVQAVFISNGLVNAK